MASLVRPAPFFGQKLSKPKGFFKRLQLQHHHHHHDDKDHNEQDHNLKKTTTSSSTRRGASDPRTLSLASLTSNPSFASPSHPYTSLSLASLPPVEDHHHHHSAVLSSPEPALLPLDTTSSSPASPFPSPASPTTSPSPKTGWEAVPHVGEGVKHGKFRRQVLKIHNFMSHPLTYAMIPLSIFTVCTMVSVAAVGASAAVWMVLPVALGCVVVVWVKGWDETTATV